jgi:hypothetical protein
MRFQNPWLALAELIGRGGNVYVRERIYSSEKRADAWGGV